MQECTIFGPNQNVYQSGLNRPKPDPPIAGFEGDGFEGDGKMKKQRPWW